MKILIVSDCPTHPTTAGNRKLILEYSILLKKLGHEIHFLYIPSFTFHKKGREDTLNSIKKTHDYWNDCYHEYKMNFFENFWSSCLVYHYRRLGSGYWKVDDQYPRGLGRFTEDLQKKNYFGACIINYVYLSKLIENISIPKIALFTHDYYTFKDILTNSKRCDKALRPNEEAKGLQRAKYIFAMQDEEAVFFQKLSPRSKVLINYCNYEFVEQPITNNHNLLFLSGPNMYNVEGIKWFILNILPLAINKIPDIKLIIGGAICSELEEYRDKDNIELKGFVTNPNDFWSLGDISINPTFKGTGLKIKTFEAMSYGKITLVHPHSTIGIFKKETAPLFASDDYQEWVSFLYDIWTDKKKIKVFKDNIKRYICDMNTFIISQYNYFFNN